MIIFITGASAGIGAATARAFAAAGHRVILAARSSDRVAALARDLDAAYGEGTALALPLDVTDALGHEAALRDLPDAWREVDVLVANAGLARSLVPVYENTAEEIDEMVDTNVKGVLYGIRAAVPGMLARGRGHVVLIGSTAGHAVYPGGTVYCATKFAVGAIAQGLKVDLHGTPLRVSLVSPGLVETEFSLVRFRGDRERAEPVYNTTRPLLPEDIAAAVLYCVQAPAHVNVQEVLITPRVQSGLAIARGDEVKGL